MEINITTAAMEALKEKIAKDDSSKGLRVYVAGIGCGGGGKASFSAIMDVPSDKDNVYEIDGVTIIYDNLLTKHANTLTIDFKPSTFEEEQFKVEGMYVRNNQ